MNLLESLFGAVTDPNTSPLHVGEVMMLWTYSVALNEGRTMCLFLLNHTRDQELKQLVEHFITDVEAPQRTRLDEFLRQEGISLPPLTPDKGKADPNVLPPGARLTDDEIANIMVAKLTVLLQASHTGLVTSLRHDVGVMLYAFHNQMLKEAFTLKQTMAKRGWLKIPPFFPIARTEQTAH